MPTVVIQFEGICINFRQVDFPFLPAAHRIVLPNFSTISNVWNDDIALHVAGFSTDLSSSTPSFPLSGSTIQISNPLVDETQNKVIYDSTYFEFMPFLNQLTPGLSGVSLALLTGHNPALASCYFDVDYGVISAIPSPFGATMTQVTIQTNGDPMYSMKPFPSGLSWSPIPEVQPQPATTSMFFWNEEQDPSDASDNDFLLSYLVVNWPPGPKPNLPPALPAGTSPNRKSTLLPTGHKFFTDVGCSNSNYP